MVYSHVVGFSSCLNFFFYGIQFAVAEHPHHTAIEDGHSEFGANLSKRGESSTKLIAHIYCTSCSMHISGSPKPTPPEVDSAIEAMYTVIPKEHREAKRKKKQVCVQQYDDIDLPPLESRTQSDGSHLQTSVTMEGTSRDEYSRLCHVGPRMNQMRKHSHPLPATAGYEQLDAGKCGSVGLCVANPNDDHSYSEVACPTSKARKHSLIDVDVPRNDIPLPPKHLSTRFPSPVESLPSICVITASDEVKGSTSCPMPYTNVASLATMDSKMETCREVLRNE